MTTAICTCRALGVTNTVRLRTRRPRLERQAVRSLEGSAQYTNNECQSSNLSRGHLIRVALLASTASLAGAYSSPAAEQSLPTEPPVGNCIDCIGEVNGDLNACAYATTSCVSTQNDDEAHFIPPWTYEGMKAKDAVQKLISVATGEILGASLKAPPSNVSFLQAPGLVFSGVLSTLKGEPVQRQQRQQQARAEPLRFQGEVQDQHTTASGCEYVRITMTPTSAAAPNVIDAEFLFPSDDAIVDIRASSRRPPGLASGNVSLSLSDGLLYDENVAKRVVEQLRRSLRFEQAPVITDFDPRFNQDKTLWFEKLFDTFLGDRRQNVNGPAPRD